MKGRIPLLAFASALLLPAVFVRAGESPDAKPIERSFPFVGDKDIKVGIKVGDVSIDSFRILHWPDPDDFRKAEKDLTDKHTMDVEFHYSNRDRENEYKCRYVVTIPGGKDGKPLGERDRTASLNKGKVDDTNKVSVRMYTSDYNVAKTIKISFQIWKK
jgi:hypothetical protein